jgi:anti-anti-sigma factor
MLRRFRRRERHPQARASKAERERASRPRGGTGRLRVEVSEDARSARIALHGEFDIASADDASRALQELLSRGHDAVVVDLAGLDFMDSTGVQFLVDGRETALARGVKLSLVPGRDPVKRVLTVSGVTALFEDDDSPRSE